jgi:hypothetical protein
VRREGRAFHVDRLQHPGLHVVADLAVEPGRPDQRERVPAAVRAADARAERAFAGEQRLEPDRACGAALRAVQVRGVHALAFRKGCA